MQNDSQLVCIALSTVLHCQRHIAHPLHKAHQRCDSDQLFDFPVYTQWFRETTDIPQRLNAQAFIDRQHTGTGEIIGESDCLGMNVRQTGSLQLQGRTKDTVVLMNTEIPQDPTHGLPHPDIHTTWKSAGHTHDSAVCRIAHDPCTCWPMRIILIQPVESGTIVRGVEMTHKCVDQEFLVAFQVRRTNNQAHTSLTLYIN